MDKNYNALIDAIKTALCHKKIINLAIDGPCASGKTSLAEMLSEEFDARIVFMDDFFLPKELRTEKRYASPENIHYERFLKEIAPYITDAAQETDLFYRRFDCHTMDYSPPFLSPFKPLTIIEGSYSMHKALRDLYDIKVLLTIDSAEQERRLLQREGTARFAVFKDRWIPLETMYFEDARLREVCDFIF